MGITRIANLTGLDRVGVPVAAAIRPNARMLSVSQGKGADWDAARVSALMEAAEGWHAERITAPLKLGSVDDLAPSHTLADVALLPRRSGSGFHPHLPVLWIEGADLLNDEGVWVPHEMVHTRFTLPQPPGSGCFPATTNGLASGNHLMEAVSHGICEVVERDATACWSARPPGLRSRVDPASVADPQCREVLDRFAAAGITAALWETTTDVGIPSFLCRICDEGRARRPLYPAEGAGCHPLRCVALLRTLTEAAQARLTLVSGARDDRFREDYVALTDGSAQRALHAELASAGPLHAFGDGPEHDTDDFGDEVRPGSWSGCARRGSAVVVVDLTRPELGVPVVRVVIPGLEGLSEAPDYARAPGRRAAGAPHDRPYVFTGPTLSPDDAHGELDAVYLPPAAQGDVYRAARQRPSAIGIIDGAFERVPAVWHKEILWALVQGIPVFGAASMGALRAAELAPFGMRGVGRIFAAFRDGELEDDDEVAVVHGPADTGYAALSDAMVNIRATLARAEQGGPARGGGARSPGADGPGALLPRAQLPRPALPRRARGTATGGITAAACVASPGADRSEARRRTGHAAPLREHQEARTGPKEVSYVFAHTDAWEAACQSAGRLEDTGTAADAPVSEESLIEELGVSGLFAQVYPGALARALALEEAHRQGHEVDSEGLREAYEAFCREQGLLEPAQRERWMEEQQVDAPVRFFQDEARVRRIQALRASEMARVLPDHLRTLGVYGALRERASHKARVLGRAGLEQPGLDEAGLTEEALWSWYFPERLGRPIPSNLERYALGEGFTGTEALRRAVLREYCASRLEPSSSHEEPPAEAP